MWNVTYLTLLWLNIAHIALGLSLKYFHDSDTLDRDIKYVSTIKRKPRITV